MKLSKKDVLLISFMLFSLFFGAGNLIFPPFLAQNAGNVTMQALATFCVTAVLLPVLGVIIVAKFQGLENLARKVSPLFATIFTILIYVSIGPGLGIPRAASLPFEMAVAPYLSPDSPLQLYLLIFSFIFFSIAIWMSLTPSRLVERIGKFLTPTLLILLVFLFISFLFHGTQEITSPQESYANPWVKGFLEGYLTMDTIAALNFGLVISTTIQQFGIKDHNTMMKYTKRTGLFAGIILASVYFMLAYMGMSVSKICPLQDNGAWTLRFIVDMVFGQTGAFLLACIFTLACLTTCIGLITSISQYFSTLVTKISYRNWVFLVAGFSFIVCNQGLSTILSISVPILDCIYPIAIVLIVLGYLDSYIPNKQVYFYTILFTGILSVLFGLEGAGISFGVVTAWLHYIPLYSMGLGWVPVAGVVGIITFLVTRHIKN